MMRTLCILLACLLTGCATRSDLARFEAACIKTADVILLCHRRTNGPNEEITIREVWKSSDHPDWKYRAGDILPGETYGGPHPVSTNWCCGGYKPPPDHDVIAFLTITRRFLVTDCGYTEIAASEIVPKEMPVFGWFSKEGPFSGQEIAQYRKLYKERAQPRGL